MRRMSEIELCERGGQIATLIDAQVSDLGKALIDAGELQQAGQILKTASHLLLLLRGVYRDATDATPAPGSDDSAAC